MKRVLIGVGALFALLVALPLAGRLMSRGTLEPSVGDAVVTPSFSGRLVDTKGQPFGNARVYMHAAIGHPEKRGQDRASMPMQHTEADGEGRFSFSGVNPGTYSVQVYWKDVADKGNFYSDAQQFWLTVSPGTGDANVTVVVPALSDQAVGGTVRDAQGQAVAGVSVEAKGQADYSRSSATTDSEGRYLVRGIAGDRAGTIWFKGAGKAELSGIAVGRTDADVTLR